MSKKRLTGIVLLVGAVVVLAIGLVDWLVAHHNKSGMGLVGLAVVLVGIGIFAFFSRASAEKVQLDSEWM